MKRFLKNIVTLLLPFAMIIGTVNYVADPANIFSNGNYEQSIATLLLNGRNVDDLKNIDERLLVKNIITQTTIKPDIVAIGTSRCLEISSSMFTDKKFINCAVSHANMNDLISIIGLLDSCNKLPSEIYLETSPTFVNPTPTNEWLTLQSFYIYGAKKMQLSMVDTVPYSNLYKAKKKIQSLFSIEYFQKSIKNTKQYNKLGFTDVDTTTPKNFGRFSDCSVTYPIYYRTPDTTKAMADAPIYTNTAQLPKIDIHYILNLQKIIKYLQSKNVKVTLVNLPFQHDCFTIIQNKYQLFSQSKTDLYNFAKYLDVRLLGTFSPYDANLSRGQFYDPLHSNKEAIKAVLNIVQYQPVK